MIAFYVQRALSQLSQHNILHFPHSCIFYIYILYWIIHSLMAHSQRMTGEVFISILFLINPSEFMHLFVANIHSRPSDIKLFFIYLCFYSHVYTYICRIQYSCQSLFFIYNTIFKLMIEWWFSIWVSNRIPTLVSDEPYVNDTSFVFSVSVISYSLLWLLHLKEICCQIEHTLSS